MNDRMQMPLFSGPRLSEVGHARGGKGKRSFFNTLVDLNAERSGDKMVNGFGSKKDIAKRLIIQELIRIERDSKLKENDDGSLPQGFMVDYHGKNGRRQEIPLPGVEN